MKFSNYGATAGFDKSLFFETVNSRFPDANFSRNGVSECDRNILVVYASEFGTTREVAEAIGEELCLAGARVDVRWINNTKDLEKYDAVIVGSAIQYDRWMPAARKFVITHQRILSRLPVAFFFTCLTLSLQNEKAERQALSYSNKLYALSTEVQPVSVGRFAGVLDYSKMSRFSRLLAKVIMTVFGIQEGDYRNWNAIRTWAKEVDSSFNQAFRGEMVGNSVCD